MNAIIDIINDEWQHQNKMREHHKRENSNYYMYIMYIYINGKCAKVYRWVNLELNLFGQKHSPKCFWVVWPHIKVVTLIWGYTGIKENTQNQTPEGWEY